jgi:hypothetical protein
MLNRAKKLNAVSTKSTAVIFSPSLPFALFVFSWWYLNMFWVHVIWVLDMLWVLGVCNMSPHMLCAFGIYITWKVINAKCAQVSSNCFLVNMNGAKGRLGEKITAILLYRLHLISLLDLTFWKGSSVYHKNWWFSGFHPWWMLMYFFFGRLFKNLTLFMTKPIVLMTKLIVFLILWVTLMCSQLVMKPCQL